MYTFTSRIQQCDASMCMLPGLRMGGLGGCEGMVQLNIQVVTPVPQRWHLGSKSSSVCKPHMPHPSHIVRW